MLYSGYFGWPVPNRRQDRNELAIDNFDVDGAGIGIFGIYYLEKFLKGTIPIRGTPDLGHSATLELHAKFRQFTHRCASQTAPRHGSPQPALPCLPRRA